MAMDLSERNLRPLEGGLRCKGQGQGGKVKFLATRDEEFHFLRVKGFKGSR